MSSTAPIEQQIETYVAGALCDAEAEAIERQIASDPAVARVYADARLRADQAHVERCCGLSRHEEPRHDEPCQTHSDGLISRLCRFFGGQKD